MKVVKFSSGTVCVLSEKCSSDELLRAMNGLFPAVNNKKLMNWFQILNSAVADLLVYRLDTRGQAKLCCVSYQ